MLLSEAVLSALEQTWHSTLSDQCTPTPISVPCISNILCSVNPPAAPLRGVGRQDRARQLVKGGVRCRAAKAADGTWAEAAQPQHRDARVGRRKGRHVRGCRQTAPEAFVLRLLWLLSPWSCSAQLTKHKVSGMCSRPLCQYQLSRRAVGL